MNWERVEGNWQDFHGKVLQQCRVPGINHFSDVGLGSLLSLRPEPKSGDQIRCLFTEVGVIRSGRFDLPPDLLLRLLSEFIECSHESVVFHRNVDIN